LKWVSRARPKIDRLACPWLIRRFIDPDGEIFYVPAREVLRIERAQEAIPVDVPRVKLAHDGPVCSFDAFLKTYQLVYDALYTWCRSLRSEPHGWSPEPQVKEAIP
jgi:hypothetical protein